MLSKSAALPQHRNLSELDQALVQVPGMIEMVDEIRDGCSTVSTEVELKMQSTEPANVNAVNATK